MLKDYLCVHPDCIKDWMKTRSPYSGELATDCALCRRLVVKTRKGMVKFYGDASSDSDDDNNINTNLTINANNINTNLTNDDSDNEPAYKMNFKCVFHKSTECDFGFNPVTTWFRCDHRQCLKAILCSEDRCSMCGESRHQMSYGRDKLNEMTDDIRKFEFERSDIEDY